MAGVFLFMAASSAGAQSVRLGRGEPPPPGRRIELKDGDTIIVRGDARVRVVHRSEATVRTIYNSEQHSLILLADYVDPKTGAPDGFVDSTYHFDNVEGVWPLGERWEGSAALDDYGVVLGPSGGLALSTNGAYVQLLQGSPSTVPSAWYADSRATQLVYRGGGHSSSPIGSPAHITFAQAEERALADAARNAQIPSSASSTASVRVGSGIRQPVKIVDVRPVLPAAAAQAGVRGVVILEVTIGRDGSVTDAKVLRSIPLLDQAAIDAVKQWRYDVTHLNGEAVPVVMTVTVSFP
jgi:protein TonB